MCGNTLALPRNRIWAQRFLRPSRQAVEEIVRVGAAEADRAQAHQYLAGAWPRRGHIGDAQVVGGVDFALEHCGLLIEQN